MGYGGGPAIAVVNAAPLIAPPRCPSPHISIPRANVLQIVIDNHGAKGTADVAMRTIKSGGVYVEEKTARVAGVRVHCAVA